MGHPPPGQVMARELPRLAAVPVVCFRLTPTTGPRNMPQKVIACPLCGQPAAVRYARTAIAGAPNVLTSVDGGDEGAVCEGLCHVQKRDDFLAAIEQVIQAW